MLTKTMIGSARLTFSQIGIIISILVYLIVRGAFVVLNIGFLWSQAGGYLSIALPLLPVTVIGFTACVVSYAYSYLGLWLVDKNQYIIGMTIVFLAVFIAPGVLAAYTWIIFPAF